MQKKFNELKVGDKLTPNNFKNDIIYTIKSITEGTRGYTIINVTTQDGSTYFTALDMWFLDYI